MDVKKAIIDFCSSKGLDSIGFTRCRIFEELRIFYENRKKVDFLNEFEEKEIENKINPFYYMKEGKSIISIAFPYLHNTKCDVKCISKDINQKAYFSKYTHGEDYHRVVSSYLKSICEYIETLGGKAVPLVDSNSLPERYIAKLCGVGFQGKNNMIITKKYGSYVFLGEIITDLEIASDIEMQQQCGECSICLKACPTKAIDGYNELEYYTRNNSNICLSYLTQKKELDKAELAMLKGRLFGCDTCQDVCPYNNEITYSKIKEFMSKEYMQIPNIEELIYMGGSIFKEKYRGTSCGWRGKNILARNALAYNLLNRKSENVDLSKIESPYVKKYAYMLRR